MGECKVLMVEAQPLPVLDGWPHPTSTGGGVFLTVACTDHHGVPFLGGLGQELVMKAVGMAAFPSS